MTTPTKILLLTSSILGDGGQSRGLAEHFKHQVAERGDVQITERDLVADALPHLDSAEFASWMVAEEERSAEQRELAARSEAALAELALPAARRSEAALSSHGHKSTSAFLL